MPLCKGCGKEVVIGHTSEGKRVPLDPVPPVFYVMSQAGETEEVVRASSKFMVNHFYVCSQSNLPKHTISIGGRLI